MSGRLGELLIRAKLIGKEQLDRALTEQKTKGGKLGSNLVRLGFIEEKDLISFLSRQFGVPAVDLTQIDIDPDLTKLLPLNVVEKYQTVPMRREGSVLHVAMADPSNVFAIDDIRFMTGLNIKVSVAAEQAIKQVIDKLYDAGDSISELIKDFHDDDLEIISKEEEADVGDLKRATEEAPVVKLVNLILTDAIKKGASDIHIEPYEREFRVRYRIDGILYEVMKPPLKMKAAISSRLKIMSNLDIAERRLPQDGRIKLKMGREREMDFRVSVMPTLFGEKTVLRLLDKSQLQLDMTKLGFDEVPLKQFKEAVYRPFGMVIVTGPTGSGKTTTLYSALTELNKVSENISTAEDPVEYNFAGINQVQVLEEIGLTFAACLRSFLRQDPDIIMVGEIRDLETAEIAIKAALTGHLVLSTLHTNNAPETITRLLNMGVEPFLVGSALNLVLAQRLVRRVCPECRKPADVLPEALVEMGAAPEEVGDYRLMKGEGCATCNFTGFKGRLALYEVMGITDEVKAAILRGGSAMELKDIAIRQGMKTLRMAGLAKLKEGATFVSEVLRQTVPDHIT